MYREPPAFAVLALLALTPLGSDVLSWPSLACSRVGIDAGRLKPGRSV